MTQQLESTDINTKTSINVIVFSKDRACQLELFLSSMKLMLREYNTISVKVLYTFSDMGYMQAYDTLKKRLQEVEFIEESEFKNDILSTLNKSHKYTAFFVDDIVWKEPFSLKDPAMKNLENEDVLSLSLRLDPNMNYCYALDTDMRQPDFDDNLCWHWKEAEGDFGYPMSVDGNIYRTSDIYQLAEQLDYHNPNTFEGELAEHPLNRKMMACMKKAPIFNIPINRVQSQYENRHGPISAEELNKLYLSGHTISIEPLLGFNNNSCHQEVEVSFSKIEQRGMKKLLDWIRGNY